MNVSLPLKIAGIGRYLPKRVVPSRELEHKLGLPEGWIAKKQGVRERRWVVDETASFMGAQAATAALDDAGMKASSIDLIINASGSQEQAIPDGAPLIQRHLGMGDGGVACMSIHATCLSFLVALDTAASLIATGRYQNVLVVSSEISSVGLNFAHVESSTLFGDGAAAVVLTRTPAGEESALLASRLETYGAGAYFTQIAGGGTRKHPNHSDTRPDDNLFYMDGPSVFTLAVKHAAQFLEKLRPGLSTGLGDIKLAVPHQASKLALEAHRFYGFKRTQIVRTIDYLGNCIAASIPLTLHEAIKDGRLQRGDKFLMLGTGAGLSIGGAILIY